jgi:[protein-PII] uridylyltransferase
VTAAERRRRADAADALCAAAFARASGTGSSCEEGTGVALLAVGGYGRRELAPHSDLDVVLVHTEESAVEELAARLWYPLWDAGVSVDHAVRVVSEVKVDARKDLRVALGLLDARHLAGDPSLTLRLRSEVLSGWRRHARERLPGLKEMVDRRVERLGELAHATVPDLKESGGGLRDTTILNALVATWLVDVPHTDLERSRQALLDVRDAVHAVAGRASDRVAPDMWPDLARALGHDDPALTQRLVREIGRRNIHISRLTWRRVEGVLTPGSTRTRRTPGPVMEPLGHGLAVTGGEVVLDRRAKPGADAALLLRAAAEAAERDLILSPHTAARLLRECPDLPDPWPDEARELLVRLLAAGPGLLAVWETLDETGALGRLLPEWERVRLLPHASQVHRFTVDRHLVETCIEASRMIRRVSRPDLLLVAALLHDIGKGGTRDHSVEGEPLAAALARRLGLSDPDVAVVAALVRWHLLLAEVATTRDLEDPATVEHVLARVPDPTVFELLAVLTEADARATSAKAWTPWRAALVGELVARVRVALDGSVLPTALAWEQSVEVPATVLADVARVDVRVESADQGTTVTVVTGDRLGVLAAVSGVLGEMRVSVRSARAWTQEQVAVSRWQVEDEYVDGALVRGRVEAALHGRVDPGERVRRTARSLTPSVAVRPEASRRATVLEVRVEDRPGVVHLVCRALADIGVAVRSAHVSAVGPQATDVFYLQEESAGALGDERAAAAAHAVRAALTGTATLDV